MPTWAIVTVSVALSLAISNLAGSLSRRHTGEDGAVAAWVQQAGSDQRLQGQVLAPVHDTSTVRGAGTGPLQQSITSVGDALRGTVNVGGSGGVVGPGAAGVVVLDGRTEVASQSPTPPPSRSPSPAPSTEPSPSAAGKPLRTTHRCFRMQPWGDICHYQVRHCGGSK